MHMPNMVKVLTTGSQAMCGNGMTEGRNNRITELRKDRVNPV